jgi:hypothetical protein
MKLKQLPTDVILTILSFNNKWIHPYYVDKDVLELKFCDYMIKFSSDGRVHSSLAWLVIDDRFEDFMDCDNVLLLLRYASIVTIEISLFVPKIIHYLFNHLEQLAPRLHTLSIDSNVDFSGAVERTLSTKYAKKVLRHVNLSDGSAVVKFKEHYNLRSIRLEFDPGDDCLPEYLLNFLHLDQLRCISILYGEFSATDIAKFLEETKVSEVNLLHVTTDKCLSFKGIEKNNSIRKLHIRDNSYSDIDKLESCKSLNSLEIKLQKIYPTLLSELSNSNLTSIYIQIAIWYPAEILVFPVTHLPNLEHLQFSGNRHYLDIQHLIQIVQKAPNLKTLIVDENKAQLINQDEFLELNEVCHSRGCKLNHTVL